MPAIAQHAAHSLNYMGNVLLLAAHLDVAFDMAADQSGYGRKCNSVPDIIANVTLGTWLDQRYAGGAVSRQP